MDLQKFCGGEEFFNRNDVFNTSSPNLSNCFQRSVLDWTPCSFLFIFGIPYFLVYRNSYNSYIPISRLFILKLIFAAVLWVLTTLEFGLAMWDWIHRIHIPNVDVISPLFVGLGMALAALCVHFDRIKGIRSSSILSIYWVLYLVVWVFEFKSQLFLLLEDKTLTTRQIWRCAIFFLSYSCIIVQFIMCFIVDSPSALPRNDPFAEASDDVLQRLAEGLVSQKKLKPLPENSSPFFSRILFEWFSKMIRIGYKRPIVENDLWDLESTDKAGRVSKHFLHVWKAEAENCKATKHPQLEEVQKLNAQLESLEADVLIEQPYAAKKKSTPSLFNVLCRVFGPSLVASTLLKLVNDCLMFVGPQLLNLLIMFIASDYPPWLGYSIAVLMFLNAVIRSVVFQNHFHISFRAGMRIRSAIVSLVYRKSLVLCNAARKESTIGEIANLMSVDAQRIMDLIPFLYAIWSSPFIIAVAMFFLWQILGASAFAGLGFMFLLVPVNAVIAGIAKRLQKTQMCLKDERIKLMSEILNGIKVLKMYAWEMSFKEKVDEIRNRELKILRKFALLNATMVFTWTCAPFVVSLVTFATYVLSDPSHNLDAQKVFVSISLFNLLNFPLILLPIVISNLVQAKVSLDRIQKFLDAEELDDTNVDRDSGPGPAISVDNGTFTWDKEEEPTLRNITMDVPKGNLVAIVGQVGSGKSSILSSLLGNMEKTHGNVIVKGSVAYVAQQAWIQNLTVRDNILFGKPVDEGKYERTVQACDLKEDFEMLPAGDLTEIGERGINLSGGQKQRVAIARAVYHDSEIYLFDDPLSAVDSHVGKHIFDNVIGPKGCLKSKTRVLVTHSVAFLPKVDNIYVLVNGQISEVGNYKELLEKNGDFAEFLKHHATYDNDDKDASDYESDGFSNAFETELTGITPVFETEHSRSNSLVLANSYRRRSSRRSEGSVSFKSRVKSGKDRLTSVAEPKLKKEDKLMTEEVVEVGNVKASVLTSYMRSIGFILSLSTILGYVLHNVAAVASNIWLSKWTGDPVVNGTQTNTTYRLTIFGVLGFTNAFFVLITAFSFSIGAIFASKALHAKMLQNMMKAPMSFFDTTPLGRIVNRFSKDIYLIDEVIPPSITSCLETFFMGVSTLFVIIFSTPIFSAVAVPIVILYYFVQRFYVRTSRQLKRLESISRSPIYSHFSETLAGVSTIRAYQLQNNFIQQNEAKIDINQRAYFPNLVSNRWLGIRMEVVGNLIVLFAAVFAVWEKGRGVDPGTVGLSVSYAMQVTGILNWLVRQASDVETNIVAVERVKEYTNVEQEAPLYIKQYEPKEKWPEVGQINFQNYSTRYRKGLDLVVKDISVQINGGEKVGIVGRTGAGKSSLTLALFRIIESAEGSIQIDGFDISKMGLHSLRSKISIIPQDPVLFSGTLRMNLDPFETYSDEELWKVLELSHLKDFVLSAPKRLHHDVVEGGENLSVGQRQLVCLARALLRKSKILVLDEATAAVDLETDALIQVTIQEQFAECTTFTIAHRLNTIMDSTRVLVMDAGRVAEYDTPENLLKAEGIFYSMAKDAGLVF